MRKKKKKKKQEIDFEMYRQTRSRDWGINPVTKVVPNKKAKGNKNACRSKVGEE